MPSSPELKPLSDRARDWVFRLHYAQLINGSTPVDTARRARACFTLDPDEWARYEHISPYVDNPREGKLQEAVWMRVADDVVASLQGIAADSEAIAAAIRVASPRWRLERIPLVDRALLTVGCWELLHRPSRPVKRVINRTVELAKQYGERDSRRFVHGILDQIRKDAGIDRSSDA